MGCKNESIQSKVGFEEKVFYEVFPQILDSLHIENYLVLPPPPPPTPEMLEERGYDISKNYGLDDWMRSDEYKNLIKDWKARRDSALNDTTTLYIAIQDSVTRYEPNDFYKLIQHFQKEKIVLHSKEIPFEEPYRVNLRKLQSNISRVKFKYLSEFPKSSEVWRIPDRSKIFLSIGYTRILFDKEKDFGVLNVGIGRGTLDGSGYRVFIRKGKSGKWVIDEIIGTWIS